jgi:hypothetical protein
MPARVKICQDGNPITSTMRHTAALHLESSGTIVNRLPLAYKRKRQSPSCKGATDTQWVAHSHS